MSLRRNILTSWVAHVVTMIVSFFMLPYVLTALGKNAYGVWLFLNALASYSSLLYMGFGATVCRYVADHAGRKQWDALNQVVSAIFAVYCVMAGVVLVASCGLAAAAPQISNWGAESIGEIRLVILMNGLATAIGMVASVYGGVLIGTQRIDLKQSVETGSVIARFAMVYLFLIWHPSLLTMSAIFLAVMVIENAIHIYFAYRQLPTLSVRLSHVRKSVLKECFGFTSYSALATIAEQLIYMTDTVVISLCLGMKEVVPYAIALRICQMAQAPLGKIGEAMLPQAGEMHATGRHGELARLCEKMTGLSFVLISACLIGCGFFARMLLDVWIASKDSGWTPADTENCLTVLMILLGAQVVAQPLVVLRKTLLGMGNVRLPSLIDLGEALINLVLSLGLVYAVGVVGVAWGTFVPLVFIELFVLLPYANREIGTTSGRLLRHAILPQIPALLGLLTYCWVVSRCDFPHRWAALIPIAGGGGLVLAAIWLLTNAVRRRLALRTSEAGADGARFEDLAPLGAPPARDRCDGTNSAACPATDARMTPVPS